MNLSKLTQNTKLELITLLTAVDFDQSRIVIADHEIADNHVTLWLEDSLNFNSTLDGCVRVDCTMPALYRAIENDRRELEAAVGGDIYIMDRAKPGRWYKEHASTVQQQWAREALVKDLFNSLIEQEVYHA